jgi:hypothetical protein
MSVYAKVWEGSIFKIYQYRYGSGIFTETLFGEIIIISVADPDPVFFYPGFGIRIRDNFFFRIRDSYPR